MIDRLLPSQRRLLALAILGVLVLAIAAIVWFPLAYLQQLDLSLDAGERHIAELQARVPGREDLLAEVRKLGDLLDMERALLPAAPRPWRRRNCRAISPAWRRPWAARLRPCRFWSPRRWRHSPGIGLRLSVVGDTATVRDFLYAVETREPMLIVRRMELSNGAAQADDLPENPSLAATFEIYGYAPASILH